MTHNNHDITMLLSYYSLIFNNRALVQFEICRERAGTKFKEMRKRRETGKGQNQDSHSKGQHGSG